MHGTSQTASPRGWIRHLPNALTTLRLVAVPLFVVAMIAGDGEGWWAFAVFAVASWTDFFDGYLARRLDVMSRFGQLADPLADRLLIVCATVLLSWAEVLPWWAVVVVVWRDALMVLGYILVRRQVLPEVNRIGKTGSAMLMLGLALLIPAGSEWALWIFWAGVIISVAAFVSYFITYVGSTRNAPDAAQ